MMNKISSSNLPNTDVNPGDRTDNGWVTIDGFKPPATQDEWEHMCFLDKTYHGFYTWPKTIKYSMNKRERYTRENMPEGVAIVFDRFNDPTFISRVVQCMVTEQHAADMSFSYIRSTVFKASFCCCAHHHRSHSLFRVCFAISAWHFSIPSLNKSINSFVRRNRRSRSIAIVLQQRSSLGRLPVPNIGHWKW